MYFFKTKTLRMYASDLVVDLELHQCGVAGHGLYNGHHTICGDEVGLNVKTLQAGVLLQHLSTRLPHTQI